MKIHIWIVALLLVALTAPAAQKSKDFREVESTSTPVYRPREAPAWKGHGRFVGRILHPPESFKLIINKASDSEGAEPFRVEEHSGKLSVYESTWLPDGKYRVRIQAEGFHDYIVKDLVIKKGNDCIMDIKFGTHVFYIY